MAMTNHERIGKALELTRDGLRGPVENAMRTLYGDNWEHSVGGPTGPHAPMPGSHDLSLLLSGILSPPAWERVWSRQFSPAHRSLVFEVRDARNRWAHQDSISSDDAYRALDSMERVLELFRAAKQRARVRELRIDLQRQVFEEERRTRQRRVARSTSGEPLAGLLPWREIVDPHHDVAENRFEQAEYAADLHAVHEGAADRQYLDPQTFFARTYLTGGLTGLITGAARRLSGQGGEPVVELQTNFGGGKTHSLIALYHLASGIPAAELPGVGEALAAEGLSVPENVSRAVLVGTQLKPGDPVKVADDITLNTLWGQMAWQLGGRAGYEILRRADETGTNPGESLAELFDQCSPALILIDEWVAYARDLRDPGDGERLPGGYFDTQFTFAQALTENVERCQGVVALISVPQSDLEVGGERGQLALARLHNVVSRKASQWQPAQADESFEIVRRRLFDQMPASNASARGQVIDAFLRMYREHPDHFPAECRERSYRERLAATYPVHPALFDHLFSEWSSLDKFQRTRGVLRLMALVIAELWGSGDKNLLIMPGTLPMHASRVSSELKKYLEDGWDPVIKSDVAGANSEPVRLDSEQRHFGKVHAARRVARTVYMGSAPGQAGSQRIDVRQAVLGAAQPGEPPAQFADALSQLAGRSNHLYADGGQYWYSLQPNVTRTAHDRAESNFSDADADAEIGHLIAAQRDHGRFRAVHAFAAGPGDVDDRDDGARLVILSPDHPHAARESESAATELAARILAQRAAGPRLNRNLLVFAAADAERLPDLRRSARLQLAWASIVMDQESLNLTAHQQAQAREQLQSSKAHVGAQIAETYRFVLDPVGQPGTAEVSWQVIALRAQGDIAASASTRMLSEERLIDKFSPRRIRMDLDGYRLWPKDDEIAIDDLWQHYARYPYLARLCSRQVLLNAAAEAPQMPVPENLFGYQKSESGNGGLILHPKRVKPADPPPDIDPPCGPPPTDTINRKTRFFATFAIDSVRGVSDIGQIMEEVVSHLGEGVEISVEIQGASRDPAGYDERTRRTVTENARHLGASQQGFDD